MKLRAIHFDAEDGTATSVDVRLSLDEAALIGRLVGKLTCTASAAIVPVPCGAHHDIYDCLAGEVFNRLYDDGIDGYRP